MMLDLLQFILSDYWPFVGFIALYLVVVIIPLRIIAVAWERRNRPIVLDKETGEKVKAS
jgi:membrane protein YdbS with pleckstrin-like domain